jgi:hypothetical protein
MVRRQWCVHFGRNACPTWRPHLPQEGPNSEAPAAVGGLRGLRRHSTRIESRFPVRRSPTRARPCRRPLAPTLAHCLSGRISFRRKLRARATSQPADSADSKRPLLSGRFALCLLRARAAPAISVSSILLHSDQRPWTRRGVHHSASTTVPSAATVTLGVSLHR